MKFSFRKWEWNNSHMKYYFHMWNCMWNFCKGLKSTKRENGHGNRLCLVHWRTLFYNWKERPVLKIWKDLDIKVSCPEEILGTFKTFNTSVISKPIKCIFKKLLSFRKLLTLFLIFIFFNKSFHCFWHFKYAFNSYFLLGSAVHITHKMSAWNFDRWKPICRHRHFVAKISLTTFLWFQLQSSEDVVNFRRSTFSCSQSRIRIYDSINPVLPKGFVSLFCFMLNRFSLLLLFLISRNR